MTKAEITLPSGAKVMLEGTDAEIKDLIDYYAGGRRETISAKHRPDSKIVPRPSSGPIGLVRDLIAEGFFREKRSLGAIQQRLAEAGHLYPQTTLSPTMLKLLKRRELRRIRDKGAWAYVNQ
jgi:hypothetical protein